MSLDRSSPSKIIAWANTLKDQLGEGLDRSESDDSVQRDAELIQVDKSLATDLGNALDLLTEVASAEESSDGKPKQEQDFSEQVVEILESSLAEWQASVSSGFATTVTNELEEQLKLTERLNAELRQDQKRLSRQLSKCADQQADNARIQVKLSRQRKSIASSLKARKAQMLLDVEQRRAEMYEQARNATAEELLNETEREVNDLNQRLEEEQLKTADLQTQLESAHKELEEVSSNSRAEAAEANELAEITQQENDSLKEKVQACQDDLASCQEELTACRGELDLCQEELEKTKEAQEGETASEIIELKEQLELCQIEIDDLTQAKEKLVRAEAELDELRQSLEELEATSSESLDEGPLEQLTESNENLRRENEELREELESLQTILAHTKQECDERLQASPASSDTEQTKELEQALDVAQQELHDLKNQNEDLASQLAKHQVVNTGSKPHVQFDQESLSWEERKALIMQQLEEEADDQDPSGQDQEQKRIEIEKILETTQSEVERRDKEIEELRSIVEQQSDTKQGVAIGAAAIAQMLDSDDLITQERQKLKHIQQEWEDKLRQAEIDLSMERAKLARERTQLEAELAEAKAIRPAPESTEDGKGKTRKWLDHLGLRDDNKGTA